MKSLLKIFFHLLVITSFVSCQESGIFGLGDEQNGDFVLYFGESVERDFIGKVLDNQNAPISGVTVEIGDQLATTDNNGIFIAKAAMVYQYFAYIKATKVGFENASATLIPTEGVNKVSLIMVNNILTQSINSGSAATVSLTNGTSITFGGSFIDKDSIAYSGAVSVKLAYSDPADSDFLRKTPGMPYGQNTFGEERILESYGSIVVELKASDGTLLYLAKDSPAEISIPLNGQSQGAAPATAPLWYFNYEYGYWIEEGYATKQGNTYLGTVTHLSSWNFSTSRDVINLYVKLTDETDKSIANQKIDLSISNSSYPYNSTSFYTNSDGSYNCIVPAGRILDLKVYSRAACGNSVVHSASINSTYADNNADLEVASDSNAITETISGIVSDCNSDPILDGYVFLNMADEQYFDLLSEGAYEINMLHCAAENTFSVRSFDYENAQGSGEINYFFTNPITYLGEIPACNAITEFVQFSIDDGNEKELITANLASNFLPFNPGYSAPSLAVYENVLDPRFRLFGLLNESAYEGVYGNYVIGDLVTRGLNIGQVIDISDTNNNIIYNLVKLGNIGEFIDLHFSGDYEDISGNPHSIIGVIHVAREN